MERRVLLGRRPLWVSLLGPERKNMRFSFVCRRLGVCKLTFVRLRSAGIADRKVPWLPCTGSIILRRARGECRGGRRRDVGTAFFCVFMSACSRGAEGRFLGLGFSCLPCGNCLWGWSWGPAARGGVSSGRSFHTEGAWCAARANSCELELLNSCPFFRVLYFPIFRAKIRFFFSRFLIISPAPTCFFTVRMESI